MPRPSPVGVHEAFETARYVRFEVKAFVASAEKVATNALDSFFVLLLGIVAEPGALLDGNCDVRANHRLNIG